MIERHPTNGQLHPLRKGNTANTKRDRYVYGLYAGDDSQPFYIGAGKRDRMFRHMYHARKNLVGRCNEQKELFLIDCLKCGIPVTEKKIAEHLTIDEALKVEKDLIKRYGRQDLGTGVLLNANDGGSGVKNASITTRKRMSAAHGGEKHHFYGKPASPERMAKIAAANKIAFSSPELRARVGQSNKGNKYSVGRVVSQETRRKISEANKRHWDSPEARAEQSARSRRNSGMRGKKHSPSAIAKISMANKGKKRTPQQVARIALAIKRRMSTPEARAEQSARMRANPPMRGKKHPQSVIAKMSAARSLWWKRKTQSEFVS